MTQRNQIALSLKTKKTPSLMGVFLLYEVIAVDGFTHFFNIIKVIQTRVFAYLILHESYCLPLSYQK